MKNLFMILLFGTFLTSNVALAETKNGRCSEHIEAIINNIDAVEPLVPFAPPEEIEYLTKEEEALYKSAEPDKLIKERSPANNRAIRLINRPYYDAWKVHININSAKKALGQLKNLPAKASIKEQLQTAANIPFELSNTRSSLDDFISAADRGAKISLTPENSSIIGFNVVVAEGNFARYLKCLAEQIRD